MPVAEKAKPRKISITTNSESDSRGQPHAIST